MIWPCQNKYSTEKSPKYLNQLIIFQGQTTNGQFPCPGSHSNLSEEKNKPTLYIVENKLRYTGVGTSLQGPRPDAGHN